MTGSWRRVMGLPVPDNGLLRKTRIAIFTAGIVLTLFGFTALAAELWRTWTGLNDIRPRYLALAAIVLGVGLALMQTLDPLRVFRLFRIFLESRMVGGQRPYDPPPETAPPMLPRDRWREVDPAWRQHNQRSGDDPNRGNENDS